MAGGTGEGRGALCQGKAGVLNAGIDGMFIEVFNFVEGLANVKEKSYHSVVGAVHGLAWLMKQGKAGGGP